MARPRWLVASRSIRPLRTIAGAVNWSSTHCRLGRGVQRLAGSAAGSHAGAGAVGGVGEVEQVGPFGVVELEGAGDRVEHGGGDAGEGAAFELGVVLDADPGQGGDLAAAQPGHPAGADVGQPGLLRGDLGASRDEELADLGTVVHAIDGTTDRRGAGMPCRYTSRQRLPPAALDGLARGTSQPTNEALDYPAVTRRFHRCVVL